MNGGVCYQPDKCSCLYGWHGNSCEKGKVPQKNSHLSAIRTTLEPPPPFPHLEHGGVPFLPLSPHPTLENGRDKIVIAIRSPVRELRLFHYTKVKRAIVFINCFCFLLLQRDVFQPVGMAARALDVTRVRVLVDSLVITVSMVGVSIK